jgi:hypothetical protein
MSSGVNRLRNFGLGGWIVSANDVAVAETTNHSSLPDRSKKWFLPLPGARWLVFEPSPSPDSVELR